MQITSMRKEFEKTFYLVEYQVLYINIDTLLLADIFEDYELSPACFFSVPEIA